MSLTRNDVERIVAEARVKNTTPSLYGANLCGEDLPGVDLRGVNLIGSDLRMANLYGADLHGASLREARLDSADLRSADLSEANLVNADLDRAYLHGANLLGVSLLGANLHETDLLRLDGLPMGQATLVPTWKGWSLMVGFWGGTVQGMRDSITKGDWPVAEGEDQNLHHRGLELLADLCDNHISRHPGVIDDLAKRWGEK